MRKGAASPPVGVTAGEVQFASLAVAAVYAVMAFGLFRPALKARAAEAAPVRARREVPAVVDRLWVSTQAWVLLAILVGIVWPEAFALSPVSLQGASNLGAVLLGALVAVGGCALVAWASKHLGAELAVAIEAREGGRLVTTGPYARVRHPIYTGVFLIVAGVALMAASPLLAAYGAVAVYCANARARAEEDLFIHDAVHGERYACYKAHTGRFLPSAARSRP